VSLLAIAAVFLWPNERSCRVAGLVLQLLGLLMVFWGIEKTRKLFGLPGMLKRIEQGWRRRPRYHLPIRTGTSDSTLEEVSGFAVGEK